MYQSDACTIMIDTKYITRFPLRAINGEIKAGLIKGRISYPDMSRNWDRLTALFSAYLDVRGITLAVEHIRSERTLSEVLLGFEGFLLKHTKFTRRAVATKYSELLRMFSLTFCFPLTPSRSRQSASKDRTDESIRFYSSCEKDLSRLKNYDGWFVSSDTGSKFFVDLHEFKELYGPEATNYILKRASKKLIIYSHHSVSNHKKIFESIIRQICHQHKSINQLKKLRDPSHVNYFMEICFTQDYLYALSKKHSLKAFYTYWAVKVGIFVKIFTGSYFVAEPAHQILTPTYKNAVHEDGEEYNNTFTPIPLTLTTDEALEALRNQLLSNREALLKACRKSCAEEIRLLNRYRRAVSKGRVFETFEGLKYNVDYFSADIAATWAASPYFSFPTLKTTGLPSEQIQKHIYMLRPAKLNPFIYLITAIHTQITPSWFTNLKLRNKFGAKTGLTQANILNVARSVKARAKRTLSVHLNDESSELFDSLVEITQEARAYLHATNNPDWRYLLLSSKKGLSQPQRLKTFSPLSKSPSSDRFKTNILEEFHKISHTDNETILRRLTLRSIRADSLVIVFLNTLSEDEVSRAAGHKERSEKLMKAYIPAAVRYFVMERWVRQYQNAIIYEVMKPSKHLLECMDFNTMEEVEWFLQNSRSDYDFEISGQSMRRIDNNTTAQADRIYISLNREKILILLSVYELVSHAIRKKIRINSSAMKWYRIACLIKIAANLATEGIIGSTCSQSAAYLFKHTSVSHAITQRIQEAVYEAA